MEKKGTRFLIEDRERLEEVIPLDTPFLLFVDPSSVCNLKCVFCPCGGAHKEEWSSNKKVNILSYTDFRRIMDQAKEFPKQIKTLRLYKEGEPLLNKRLPDMIHYARNKEVAKKIDFTTNGVLFNEDLNFALIDAGVDRINISVEALDSEGYLKNAGMKIDYKKFIANLRHLYRNRGNCHIFIKISDVGLGDNHSESEFYETFGEMSDEMSIEYITPVWPEFDIKQIVRKDYDRGIYGNKIKEIAVCPYIFYSITVNSDMSVSACLMDWNHKHIVGNLNQSRLVDLWNGQSMQNIRIDHLKDKKDRYEICSNCGQLPFGTLDNLDQYKEQLLTKILKNE